MQMTAFTRNDFYLNFSVQFHEHNYENSRNKQSGGGAALSRLEIEGCHVRNNHQHNHFSQMSMVGRARDFETW
jgi:hypothetical protein